MRLSPAEAANHYVFLEATEPYGVAASFARDYEDKARPEDFDAYLHFLDLHYGAQVSAAA